MGEEGSEGTAVGGHAVLTITLPAKQILKKLNQHEIGVSKPDLRREDRILKRNKLRLDEVKIVSNLDNKLDQSGMWPSHHLHLLLKSKTSLRACSIIPPPIRHRRDLTTPKEQKDQQHVQIKPGIKRCRQDIIIPRPQLIPVPKRPIHDHKRPYKLR